MSTRFFTNHGEQTLLRKFQGVFESNADIEWFDALVGFLRASGYFAIRPFLGNISHILDMFPIVRRKDEEEHGRYRTKETILEIYDALAEAQRTGQSYATRFDPLPADPNCRHPPQPVR